MNAYRRATALAHNHQTGLAAIGIVVATAAILILWLWSARSERRELEKMDAEERRALYTETLRTTELLCARPPIDRALAERCQSFADFLVAFPECDAGCQSLVRSLQPTPTK